MFSINSIFRASAWKHKLWLYRNTIIYLIVRIYCFNKKAIFCYGSVGDTFTMIQHSKIFISENPNFILIGSKNYQEVFRIFGISDRRLLTLSEHWCVAIFNHSYYSTNSFKFNDSKFLNLNINVHENLRKLIINSNLTMREVLSRMAPIINSNLIKNNYPMYSDNDKLVVKDILSSFIDNKDKTILVNPIGYTHKSITRVEWDGIAGILECAGYKIIFNVANNCTRPKHDEWFNCPNAIEVPAHLLPLLSKQVRLTLARPGGAFDLSFGYSQDSDVLILFFKNKKIYEEQTSDFKEIHMQRLLTADFGRDVKCIEISEDFSPKVVANEILLYLNNGNSGSVVCQKK
jgi:hypothetical protein